MCRPKVPKVERDQTITPKNAVTKLYVDSLDMEKFIAEKKLEDSSANRLRNFYNSRNFQFAWLAETGLAERAKIFYDLDKSYKSKGYDSGNTDLKLNTKLDESRQTAWMLSINQPITYDVILQKIQQ